MKESVHGPSRTKRLPEFFTLTVNYRSQQGILALAQAILELITSHWPHSIDHVPAEIGHEGGKKPVFFITHEEGSGLLQRLIANAR